MTVRLTSNYKMDIFNNRELATGFWVTIFFIWAMTKKDVISSLKQVIKVLLSKFIVIPFLIMVVYTLIMVAGLDFIGLWEEHQIKNVVFWFFSAAVYSFFQITKASEERYYFSNAIKDNLKIIVVLQFIISVYTFSLWAELLFVPFMALLGGMIALSQAREEHKTVEKLLNGLFETIGVFILIFTLYKLITNFGEFGKVKSIYDLLIPTTLSLLLLPFLYLLAVFNNYQSIFIRLKYFIKDTEVLKYAKLASIKKCHFRFSKLVRWADSLACMEVKSKEDIDTSFGNLFRQLHDEKNPPFVSIENGWSPHIAKDYLLDLKLKTGFYKNIYDDTWHASSSYLEIGNGIMSNNIAYYVEGGRESAKSLTLKLNVNEPESTGESHETFLEIVFTLFEKAMNAILPDDICTAIANGTGIEKCIGHQKVSITKSDWYKGGKYDLTFKLETV